MTTSNKKIAQKLARWEVERHGFKVDWDKALKNLEGRQLITDYLELEAKLLDVLDTVTAKQKLKDEQYDLMASAIVGCDYYLPEFQGKEFPKWLNDGCDRHQQEKNDLN